MVAIIKPYGDCVDTIKSEQIIRKGVLNCLTGKYIVKKRTNGSLIVVKLRYNISNIGGNR